MEKPSCYGSRRDLDERSHRCTVCEWRRVCTILARRNGQGTGGDDRPSSREERRSDTLLAPDEYEEREDAGGLGFFSILLINGILSSIGAGLREATYAVDHTPRLPYPDVIGDALKRRKRE